MGRYTLGRGMAPAEEASFGENFINQWWFHSGIEDELARMRIRTEATFGGRHPPVEGYNPFADPAELRGYEDNAHHFRDSRSPSETAAIKEWVNASVRRARELEAMVGNNLNVSGFLAGVLTPGNLITAPLGIAPGLVRGALTGAAGAALGETIDTAVRGATMPAQTAGDPPVTIAGAALFGAALGGVFGKAIDMSTAGRLADLQERLDEYARLREAGVPMGERTASAAGERTAGPADARPDPVAAVSPLDAGAVRALDPRALMVRRDDWAPEHANDEAPWLGEAKVERQRLLRRADEARTPEERVAAEMELLKFDVFTSMRLGMRYSADALFELEFILRGEADDTVAAIARFRGEAASNPDFAGHPYRLSANDENQLPSSSEVRWLAGLGRDPVEVGAAANINRAVPPEVTARLAKLDEDLGAILRELDVAEAADAQRLILAMNKAMDERAAIIDDLTAQLAREEAPRIVSPPEMAKPVEDATERASLRAAAIKSDPDLGAPTLAAGAPPPPPATGVADTPPGPLPAPPEGAGGGGPPKPPDPVGMRAPNIPEGADRIAPGSLLDKLRWRQMPWHYLKNLPAQLIPEDLRLRVSQAADLLADSPGLHYVGEGQGWRPEQSVENAIKVLSARLMRANRAIEQAWFEHRGFNTRVATGGTAGQVRRRITAAADRVTGTDGKMDWDTFNRQVGEALAAGHHTDPHVSKAMQAHREFYDWYQQEAINLGLVLTPEKLAARVQARRDHISRLEMDLIPRLHEMLKGAEEVEKNRGPSYRPLMTPEMQRAHDETVAELTDVWSLMLEMTDDFSRVLEGAELASYQQLVSRRVELRETLRSIRASAGVDKVPVTARLREKIEQLEALAEELHVKLGQDLELQARQGRVGPKADPQYVPHLWRPDAIARDPRGLADVVAKDWVERNKLGWERARPDMVTLRADALVANMAGGGPDAALKAVITRWHELRGMTPDEAAMKAEAVVAPIRASLRESGTSRIKREVQSLLARDGDREWTQAQRNIVNAALKSQNVPLYIRHQGENFSTGLADAIFDVGDEGKVAMDFGGSRAHLENRSITAATADLVPWLHLNADELALQYHRTVAPVIETARRFGDSNLERFTEALRVDLTAEDVPLQVQDRIVGSLKDLRDVVAGRYGMPADPTLWTPRALRLLTQHAVLTQMGKAVLSAVADLGRTGWAVGFREMFGTVMDAVAKDSKGLKMAMAEADEMGAAAELVLMSRANEMSGIHPGDFGRTSVERFYNRMTNTLNLINLLAPWTDMMKRFSGAVMQSQIMKDAAALADGTITPERHRVLRERVSDEMAIRMAVAWDAQGRPTYGRMAIASAVNWQDQKAAQMLRAAIARGVEAAVPTPGAPDRPLFMRTPLGRAVFLYRGFALGATQRILGAALQERDKRALSGIAAMIALAWLIEGSRQSPHERHPITSPDRLYNAVERSGVLGILTDINTMVEVYSANQAGARPLLGLDPQPWHRNPNWVRVAGTAALGGAPAFEPWLQALWAFTSDEARGSDQAAAIRRLVILNNYLVWDGMVTSIQRDVGSTLEGE